MKTSISRVSFFAFLISFLFAGSAHAINIPPTVFVSIGNASTFYQGDGGYSTFSWTGLTSNGTALSITFDFIDRDLDANQSSAINYCKSFVMKVLEDSKKFNLIFSGTTSLVTNPNQSYRVNLSGALGNSISCELEPAK